MKTSWTCLICDRDYQNRREAQACNDGHEKDYNVPLTYQGVRPNIPAGAECPPSLKDSPPMPVESRQAGLTKAQFIEATDAIFLTWIEKYMTGPGGVLTDSCLNEDYREPMANNLIAVVQEARRRIVRLQNEVEL